MEPTCMVMKCTGKENVEILVNSSWVDCGPENKVKANGFTINCPSDRLFCSNKVKQPSCMHDNDMSLSIRLLFTDPSFDDLLENNNFKNFKVSTVRAIAASIGVPINYIVNATLVVFSTMYLDFSICPPSSLSNDELGSLLQKTQNFLKNPFAHIFKGVVDYPVTSTNIAIEPEVAVSFSDHEGFRMLLIIPVVCGIFVAATFIASLLRLAIIQRHRPKRETVELEEFSESNFSTQLSNQMLTA